MSDLKKSLTDKEIALQLTIEVNKLETSIIEFDRFVERKSPYETIKDNYTNFLEFINKDK